MKHAFLVAAVFGGAAVSAAAQNSSAPITPPEPLKRPTAAQYAERWPTDALKKGIGGHATLDCAVNVDGLLEDCQIKAESPPGMGFGRAAMALTPEVLMRPAMQSGHAVGGSRAKVRFDFDAYGITPDSVPGLGTRIPGTRHGETVLVTSRAPWTQAPSSAQLADAYPKAAKADTAFGHVILSCRFKPNGALKNCDVDSEEPQGQGFGSAARSLVVDFQMDVRGVKPEDLGRLQISLPVHFVPSKGGLPERVLEHPEWLPGDDTSEDFFPPKAAATGLATGRASLDCIADFEGRMKNCTVSSEEPAGLDFGAAAIRIASHMRLNPWTDGGEPADGAHVRLTIRVNKAPPPGSNSTR
jgi:TonB family protein